MYRYMYRKKIKTKTLVYSSISFEEPARGKSAAFPDEETLGPISVCGSYDINTLLVVTMIL